MLPLYIAIEMIVMAIAGGLTITAANGVRLAVADSADTKTITTLTVVAIIMLAITIGTAWLTGTIDPIQRSAYVYGASTILATIIAVTLIRNATK